ncbi:phospholipase effector Tle1 domain-containing protein [Sphingomonas koreensis]
MRRLVFCFDGTWNKIDGNYPTNVARVAQSVSRYDRDISQIIYYDEGVGTSATEKWTGGIFGHGLIEKIIEAYHFLILNYEPGDQIYVFGFSRGAFAARSFVGLIRNCGIISRRSLTHIRAAVELYISRDGNASPNSERSRNFRLKHCPKLCLPGDLEWRKTAYPDHVAPDLIQLRIAYLGVWDTVGALGIPRHLKWFAFLNRKFMFHDTKLSGFVDRARHAVSTDERRRSFEPSLWTNLDDLNASDPATQPYEQLFFPGTHSAVGGGGPVRGLSDAALEWIIGGARMSGLALDRDDQSPIFSLLPDHRAQLFNATGKTRWSLKDRIMGVGLRDRSFPEMDRRAIHPTIARRYHTPAEQLPEKQPYRPPALRAFWEAIEQMGLQQAEKLRGRRIELKSAGDDRALRAPARVRRYVVQKGDTLTGVAERQMGSVKNAEILGIHNRNVGLLFEDDVLYAGSELEIPEYDPTPAPIPQPAPASPPPPDQPAQPTTPTQGF